MLPISLNLRTQRRDFLHNFFSSIVRQLDTTMTDSEKTLVSSEPPVAPEIEAPTVGKPVSPAGPPPLSSSASNDTQRKLLKALKATDYNIERLDR